MREKLNRNHQVRIVYYLGAGASANAIPMVGEISKALIKFRSYIQMMINEKDVYSTDEQKKEYNDFKVFCYKYSDIVISAPSIDTYAKRLWDLDLRNEYMDYKLFLVILFNFFHFLETKKDLNYALPNTLEGRYENLIRSINIPYGKSVLVPKQFSFISWNYDFQLEATLAREFDDIYPLDFSVIKEKLICKIINLNGSSNINGLIEYPDSINSNTVFEKLLGIYKSLTKNPKDNKLKFAWEQNLDFFSFSDFRETRFVVVIGYSFPSFNRDIDKLFFNQLKTDSQVENEYGVADSAYRKTKVFTQGYDYTDSIRIKRYLEQIFDDHKAPFEIIPVESPFFYVPSEYWK